MEFFSGTAGVRHVLDLAPLLFLPFCSYNETENGKEQLSCERSCNLLLLIIIHQLLMIGAKVGFAVWKKKGVGVGSKKKSAKFLNFFCGLYVSMTPLKGKGGLCKEAFSSP